MLVQVRERNNIMENQQSGALLKRMDALTSSSTSKGLKDRRRQLKCMNAITSKHLTKPITLDELGRSLSWSAV